MDNRVEITFSFEQIDVADDDVLAGRVMLVEPIPAMISLHDGGLSVEPEGYAGILISLDNGHLEVIFWDEGGEDAYHTVRLVKLNERDDHGKIDLELDEVKQLEGGTEIEYVQRVGSLFAICIYWHLQQERMQKASLAYKNAELIKKAIAVQVEATDDEQLDEAGEIAYSLMCNFADKLVTEADQWLERVDNACELDEPGTAPGTAEKLTALGVNNPEYKLDRAREEIQKYKHGN